MEDVRMYLHGVVFTFRDNQPVVVLQKRGPLDFTGKAQKYAGSYQFTVSGQVGGMLEHLFRDGALQLGDDFVSQLKKYLLLGTHGAPTGPDLNIKFGEERMDIYIELFLPPFLFLASPAGNLLYLSREMVEKVQPLTLADEMGVTGDAIKMFAWDIEELKRIFGEGKMIRVIEDYRLSLQEP
ncbi:MAG: hypothetical protein WC528_00035 [Patescibacteria group bacterium]